MVKEIVHDPFFLAQKSDVATKADLSVAKDLVDTLIANKDACVGMAANMIGVKKRIIVFDNDGFFMTMFNPEIISKFSEYETEEGCLSLTGIRSTKRFKTITVSYKDFSFKPCQKTFTGWTAQIIQHEIDHCNGVLI
ncbi:MULTISPECIES: peptide deformylase [unclassified Ruminococcus]|uniref:peptide deformylase n=1 Tax=unclassified Ruminococcus TaxID=2608920 RepID=UPI002109A8CA|nr:MULTISPECIES: peptide deformylase [unclassified Ruminococcus]MCQ4021683.1 peptide deformylase [Ruminococcus sp. zg-924]MCQ4114128.1 peptide deformylase [Ruminococcus sp. zg-921]